MSSPVINKYTGINQHEPRQMKHLAQVYFDVEKNHRFQNPVIQIQLLEHHDSKNETTESGPIPATGEVEAGSESSLSYKDLVLKKKKKRQLQILLEKMFFLKLYY